MILYCYRYSIRVPTAHPLNFFVYILFDLQIIEIKKITPTRIRGDARLLFEASFKLFRVLIVLLNEITIDAVVPICIKKPVDFLVAAQTFHRAAAHWL